MGLGSTAKKLQKVADMAETLYERMNELREQVKRMQASVEESERRLDSLASEVTEQRAILEALAEERGIDLDTVTAEAHIEEAERDPSVRPDVEQDGEDAAGSEGTTDDESRTTLDGGEE